MLCLNEMQLTRLDIKGFKSFGDKTTLHFDKGITAIAGPNGCGKSNVIDAIRWVLGEQSTRALRSEKMENIIFNGSKSRKASQLAEVSLSFDNTKNILPTDYSQITLTRKLYRSGESEYRLNNVQCRLKDITDLFLDTGIGPDSYSIIELKMVDEIIANRESSRRALFEEASGISKYKLRRKQTLTKLKDTETDISRVNDILHEIEKNLKTLESQARKAEKYYRLKEQYQEFSLNLASIRIEGFRKLLKDIEAQELEHLQVKQALITEMEAKESALKELKSIHYTKENNLSLQRKAANEFITRIRIQENDKKIKNEQLRFLNEKERRISDDLERDQSQLKQATWQGKRLEEDRTAEYEKLQALLFSTGKQKKELDTMSSSQGLIKKELDQAAAQVAALQEELLNVEKELTVLTVRKESLVQESKRNSDDTALKQDELEAFSAAMNQIEGDLKQAQEKLLRYEKQESEALQCIYDEERSIEAFKKELTQTSRRLDSRQNEYNLTKSMVDNLEGFPESVRFLKNTDGWAATQAPLLSDIFYCPQEYRISIETYLEPLLNHYVVDTWTQATSAVGLLSAAAKGRAGFFILEALEDLSAPDIRTPAVHENLVAALSVLESEQKYKKLCAHLLKGVYLQKAGQNEDLTMALPVDVSILISAGGKFYKSRTVLSGGSIGLFEGKRIGRTRSLENLANEIRSAETTIGKLENHIKKAENRIKMLRAASVKATIKEIAKGISELSTKHLTIATRRDQYLKFIHASFHRKESIEQSLMLLDKELQIKRPALELLRGKKEECSTSLFSRQQGHAVFNEQFSKAAAAYNEENIRLHQQQNRMSGIEKDIEYKRSQTDMLNQRIQAASVDLLTTLSDIKAVMQQLGHSDDDLLTRYEQKDAFEKGLRDLEREYYESRETISTLENAIAILRKNKEHTELISSGFRERKNNLRLELHSLKERLEAEFDIQFENLLVAELTPGLDEELLKEKTDRVKKQMLDYGAVNPMAVETFREMSKRHTFIKDQKADLEEAKRSLLETVSKIDSTAQERFVTVFSEVRENFISVFRSLFNEEDSCDLSLSDYSNPLEADIEITAFPKGKKPLSINQLSGGEKTLTATALLFSLYLCKPAPFCIFDEVDAPLDDTNIDKFNTIIRTFSSQSQFIIVSHNKRTLASTDVVYGVTMIEQGVSKIVAVDMKEVATPGSLFPTDPQSFP